MSESHAVVDLSNCSENIKWDVNDVTLLLKCVQEFKATKENEGIDWETIKDKYEAVRIIFQREKGDCEDQSKFSRDRIATKIKALRGNYKKAVDSGGRASRMTAIFYDLCKEIWADYTPTGNHRSIMDVHPTRNIGSAPPPAVDSLVYYEQFPNEYHIVNFKRENATYDESNGYHNDRIPTTNADAIRDRKRENGSATNSSIENFDTTVQNENTALLPSLRFIDDKKKKSDKRAATSSVEQQLLDIVKEDFAFKRQLLTHISRQDEQFNTALLGMQQTITTFTQTMSSFMERLNKNNGDLSQSNNQGGEQQGQSSNTNGSCVGHCSCRCQKSHRCCCH